MDKNQKDNDKKALNGALEIIVDEISGNIEHTPQFTDFAQEEPRYHPEQYIVSLIPEKNDITVILTKEKTRTGYESFQQYWDESKKVLTDAERHPGQKLLKNREILINFIQYYGFDLLHPDIKPIADLMKEITSRIHRYGQKHEKYVRAIQTNAIIHSEDIKSDTREALYDLFLLPETLHKIKRYETKLDNKRPLRFSQRTGKQNRR